MIIKDFDQSFLVKQNWEIELPKKKKNVYCCFVIHYQDYKIVKFF